MTSPRPTAPARPVHAPTGPDRGYAQVLNHIVGRYAESSAASVRLRLLLRENARLYEEARRRQEWLQEAAELSSGTLAVVPEAEALALVGRSVQKLADAEVVTAWAPVPGGGRLQLATGLDDHAEALGDLDLSEDDPLVAEVLVSNRGALLDLGSRPGSPGRDALAGLHVGPVLALPVPGAAGVRGLLLVGRHVGRPPFSEVDLDMAETFVGHVAMSLELMRARTVAQRVAQLEDRERIASGLHEHVASGLLAIGTKMQSAAAASSDPRLRDLLHEIVGELDATLGRLRSSIFQLGGSGGVPSAQDSRPG